MRISHRSKRMIPVKNLNQELELLIKNVPGGVFRYTADEAEQFSFISDGLFKMLGYTEAEFRSKFNNCFSQMVYGLDRLRIRAEIDDQIRRGADEPLEYRVETKTGELKWIYDMGQSFTDYDGKRWCYAVATDISAQKKIREKIRMSEEQYRIIMEESSNAIYMWDVIENKITFSDAWAKKFNFPLHMQANMLLLENTKLIFRQDIPLVKAALKKCIEQGVRGESTDIRIATGIGELIWCRVTYSPIFDDSGKLVRIVGLIMDIDKDMQETESLRIQSITDGLTKILNKSAVEQGIAKHLSVAKEDAKHSVYIIDVDCFKNTNDTYGHLVGDAVLRECAKRIASLFRPCDIVGRMGGDEFFAFAENLWQPSAVRQRGDAICRAVRRPFYCNGIEVPFTVSVGVATFPGDGKTFEELYANADRALYEAKEQGRDVCVRYAFKKDALGVGSRAPAHGSTALEKDLTKCGYALK